MRQCTLVFLIKPDEQKILLAMKKRGFGAGKWNGVGGKLHEGETVKDAAIREAREEISVELSHNDLTNVAVIDFFFEGKKEFDQQVHVFFVGSWQGEPSESDEMRPEWYSCSALPFSEMWVDDIVWLSRAIAGEKIKAKFVFDESGSRILSQNIEII
jgi:ADP-ribose pyrophosphatase YjhB (NUDIX family)